MLITILLSIYFVGLNNPYSLDVWEDKLYWVSLTGSELRDHDKFGRGVNTTMQTGLYNVKDLKMFQGMRYNTSSKFLLVIASSGYYVKEYLVLKCNL